MITFTNNYAGAEPARTPRPKQPRAPVNAPPMVQETPQGAPLQYQAGTQPEFNTAQQQQQIAAQQGARQLGQASPQLGGGVDPYSTGMFGQAPSALAQAMAAQAQPQGHMGGLANPNGNAYGLNYGQTFMGQQPQPPVSAPQGPAVYNDGLLGSQSAGPAMPPPQPQSMSPFFNMRRGFRFNRP